MVIKTTQTQLHFVDGVDVSPKELRRFLRILKETNPSIYYNPFVESYLNQKCYDRTPHKNMESADMNTA